MDSILAEGFLPFVKDTPFGQMMIRLVIELFSAQDVRLHNLNDPPCAFRPKRSTALLTMHYQNNGEMENTLHTFISALAPIFHSMGVAPNFTALVGQDGDLTKPADTALNFLGRSMIVMSALPCEYRELVRESFDQRIHLFDEEAVPGYGKIAVDGTGALYIARSFFDSTSSDDLSLLFVHEALHVVEANFKRLARMLANSARATYREEIRSLGESTDPRATLLMPFITTILGDIAHDNRDGADPYVLSPMDMEPLIDWAAVHHIANREGADRAARYVALVEQKAEGQDQLFHDAPRNTLHARAVIARIALDAWTEMEGLDAETADRMARKGMRGTDIRFHDTGGPDVGIYIVTQFFESAGMQGMARGLDAFACYYFDDFLTERFPERNLYAERREDIGAIGTILMEDRFRGDANGQATLAMFWMLHFDEPDCAALEKRQ